MYNIYIFNYSLHATWINKKIVQYICIIHIFCVIFWPSHLCWLFLYLDCCISKLPISSPSMALSLCSLGDISNTKIAPCKLQWPAPYSSIYHIKIYCSTVVTFHSSISVSLFRFPADWQCRLQHFTQFFFSMCEIAYPRTVKRESAGFSTVPLWGWTVNHHLGKIRQLPQEKK